MSRVFKFIIFFFFPLQIFSQTAFDENWKNYSNLYENLFTTVKKKEILSLNTYQNISSSGLNNKLIYPFILKQKLNKNDIDKNLEKRGLKKINIDRELSFSYINLKKSLLKNKRVKWMINIGNESRNAIKLSNDAAKLIFRGNTDTTKYNLDGSNYFNLDFSKIGVGVFYSNQNTQKLYNLSFALNVIKVNNYSNIVSYSNNFLKSNEDSFDIGLNYDATFASSSFAGFDGMGISSDFSVNYKYNKNSIFSIKIKDLGFADFNNSVSFYTSNNTYKFNGIIIPDITRLNDDSYFKNQADSTLNNFSKKQENLDKTIFIAPQTEIFIASKLKKGYYSVSIKHNGTKSQPDFGISYFGFLKPYIIGRISTGHLNNFYINSDAMFSFNNKLFLHLGINHIEALLFPLYVGGIGFNTSLQIAF